MNGRVILALVPMKPFAESKHRLAEVLGPAERMALARRMFEHTVEVLSSSNQIARVMVISRDDEVLELARSKKAWAIWEGNHGLNTALEQATRVAIANGADAVLAVPADLPRLAMIDIAQMIELGKTAPCLVAAPARRDEGTNALFVNPAGLIHYAFGPSSYREHCRRGEQAGARVYEYRSETVELDIDLPIDLEQLGRSAIK